MFEHQVIPTQQHIGALLGGEFLPWRQGSMGRAHGLFGCGCAQIGHVANDVACGWIVYCNRVFGLQPCAVNISGL